MISNGNLFNLTLKHNWLLEGLHPDYDGFIPFGTKEAKSTDGIAAYTIFKSYSHPIKGEK
jgi:hypothetical protein